MAQHSRQLSSQFQFRAPGPGSRVPTRRIARTTGRRVPSPRSCVELGSPTRSGEPDAGLDRPDPLSREARQAAVSRSGNSPVPVSAVQRNSDRAQLDDRPASVMRNLRMRGLLNGLSTPPDA